MLDVFSPGMMRPGAHCGEIPLKVGAGCGTVRKKGAAQDRLADSLHLNKGLPRVVSTDAGRRRALAASMWPDIQAKSLAWGALVDCCSRLSRELLINE